VLTPESRISEVTIYPDRAAVRRVVERLHLEAGSNAVLLSGLPGAMEPGSVRAEGRGDPGVTLANVDVQPFVPGGDEPIAADTLASELESVRDSIRQIEAQAAGLETGRELLASILEAKGIGGEADAPARFEPASWKAALGFVTEEMAANRRAFAEGSRRLEELRERESALRRELSGRDAAHGRGWNVFVELQAESESSVDLTVDYTTNGAGWTPEYDVIVSDDLKSIEIVCAASVTQRTGEDWLDVALTLSSAEPGVGAQLPDLSPWWLAVPQPVQPPDGLAGPGQAHSIRVFDSKQEARISAINTTEERPQLRAVPIGESALTATHGIATTFSASSRQDLRSDGRARRLRLGTVSVEGRVSHEAVPKLAPWAFLVASARNSSDSFLLPGPSRVTVGGQFLGHGWVEAVAPGQQFALALGVDRSVQVTRQLVNRREDVSGERHRFEAGYLIEVANRRSSSVTVALRDQIPLSPDEDVTVRARGIEPAPAEGPDADGFLEWRLEIPGGERREVRLGHEVRYPAGRRPMNLHL
jgi:uncharacterized protein (TIGR02231 family)